ncbi:MAG: FimV/HubP family polar landmark protein [Halopseudomonas sp.]
MLRKSAISLAVVGALVATQANALGLGEVEVSSALNQPLKAEIDLLQLRGLNASQIITSLADTDDFYLAGVKPSAVLSDLRFKLDLSGGQGKIILTTNDPIREPFLNFLIEVNWPSGRLVREYTVLLDPPVFTAEDLAPRSQPKPPVAQAATPASKKKSSRSRTASAAPSKMAGSDKYRVSNDDTLWQIALKTRPDSSISPQQMMLAIQRANPSAFFDNNINRLKSGVVLDIPNKQQILNIDAQDSVQEVKRQNSSWKGAPAATTKKPSAAKLDTAKAEMNTGKAAAAEDAQLRIVSKAADKKPAQPVKSDTVASEVSSAVIKEQPLAAEISAKNEELEEQLVVTLEGLDKVERDNAEMFDRLDRLSEQMESMQRLVELKDQQLAQLQGQLAQKQGAPATPVSAPAATQKSMFDGLPLEWIGAAAAGVLALLAGLLMVTRKRKQNQEVEDALVVLNERDGDEAIPASVSAAPEVGAVAEAATVAPLDQVDDSALDEIVTEDDADDPFNMSTDSSGPVDEFDSISDDELDSALGDDLDMDLKLDEPVVDDPEMAAFSNSLLDDDEYDLSTGFDEDEDVANASDADAGLDSDLDALLAESDADAAEVAGDDAGVDLDGDLDALLAESDTDATGLDGDDAGVDLDSDLDALLAESGLDESIVEEEPQAGLEDGLDDGFGSELDDLLAENDAIDPLLGEEETTDAALEQILEDHDATAESSGIESVALDLGEDEIPDDDTLDALLNQADDQGGDDVSVPVQQSEQDELDQGIDIEFDAIEDFDAEALVANAEETQVDHLTVDELPEQALEIGDVEEEVSEFELDSEREAAVLDAGLDLDDFVGDTEAEPEVIGEQSGSADDTFAFELDDATDDALDFSVEGAEPAAAEDDLDALLQQVESDAGTEVAATSSLSLEDDLDEAGDAELEAELEQMLESEDNALALQETDLEGDEVNYLDEADEVGTKIDLARAYIDMEDHGGARDILQEVINEGSPEQVSEAKQLLESLNS